MPRDCIWRRPSCPTCPGKDGVDSKFMPMEDVEGVRCDSYGEVFVRQVFPKDGIRARQKEAAGNELYKPYVLPPR